MARSTLRNGLKAVVEAQATAGGYMDHEPGDPSVRVTREAIAAALREVGVRQGDTAMFHSSLSSMGTVEGGAEAVIDGFLDAVGPAGTVAVPTLSQWRKEREKRRVWDLWDIATTPTYCGLIPETFRQRPEAQRSNHYTHSVSAIGARAAAYSPRITLERDCGRVLGALARSPQRALGSDSTTGTSSTASSASTASA